MAIQGHDPEVRAAAAHALSGSTLAHHIQQRLGMAIEGHDPEVRAAAAEALGRRH